MFYGTIIYGFQTLIVCSVNGCNYSQQQCQDIHDSGDFTTQYGTDCYPDNSGAHGLTTITACVDTCDPETKDGLKCEDYCESKGKNKNPTAKIKCHISNFMV